ncbi:SpaA isopeptide-forming pilin-related protein [Microbacterium soli]|uniref:VWFA domain-containing protein n=1 Tax=Microbacterium soli TaxID=446075 RepID=A0ABP7MPL0_9MICO
MTKRVFAEPTSVNGPIGDDVRDTAGSTFRLYTDDDGEPGSATAFTCTIVADGECRITVTGLQKGGDNRGERFWVVEEDAEAGSDAAEHTYINSELYVGAYTGPRDLRRIVGLTKALEPSSTPLAMPMTASQLSNSDLPRTNATTAEAGSFGAVVGSYKNPTIVPKCEASPLRIGIILDQSASISGDQWRTFRGALVDGKDSVLRLLRDANARVSVLGFGSGVSGQNGWHHGGASGPAALPTNNDSLEQIIPASRPGGSGNTTNWDAALSTFQQHSDDYDMVLFVTDGAPNYILDGTGPSNTNVTLRSLEAPMYAANALKKHDVRVVAVGVGEGASGEQVAQNLRAVSGEKAGSDYLQGDWDGLKRILSEVVTAATCQVPVEVSKTLKNADGSTTKLAGDWDFTAALTPGTSSPVSLLGDATQTTDSGAAGAAHWTVKFTQPSGQAATLKIEETAQPGWTLDAVDCTLDARTLPTTVDGDSVTISDLGPASGALKCTFTNSEAKPATVTVDKKWVVDGEKLPHGDQPDGMDATLRMAIQGDDVSDVAWGQTRSGFTVGDSVTIGEDTTLDASLVNGCVLTGSTIAGPGIKGAAELTSDGYDAVLTKKSNVYTVTNTVQCQRLTLVKKVHNSHGGQATPADWDGGLFAQTGTAAPIAFDSGETRYVGVGEYVLSESDEDGYSQAKLVCTGGELTGSTVSIKAGADVVCTFKNVDDAGSVTWTKTADDGTTALGGSVWTLTGPGLGTDGVVIEDCTSAADCSQLRDRDPAEGSFLMGDLDWGEYSLVETKAPRGYVLDATPHEFTIAADAVTVDLGALVNTEEPVVPEPEDPESPVLPLTGSDGALWMSVGAIALILIAGGVLLVLRRTRTQE